MLINLYKNKTKMKQLITLLTTFMVMSFNAQTLKVTYAEKLDLSKKLKSAHMNWIIKKMVIKKAAKPKYFELVSVDGVSIYKKQPQKEENVDDGVTIEGDMSGNDIIYKNHKENELVKQTEFMSRTFLINGKLPKYDWVITKDTLKIGDYLCHKAVLKGNDKFVVWFTNDIPVNDGPREYNGLPGLILKVDADPLHIEATKIGIVKDKVALQKPTKGKKVTLKEFEKIKKEKTESSSDRDKKKKDVEVEIIGN